MECFLSTVRYDYNQVNQKLEWYFLLSMGNYVFIEHTADKGYRVTGNDLRDLFETSARGLAGLMREDLSLPDNNYPVSKQLDLKAQDETALLVDFLSEILTLSHIHKTVFTRTNIKEITGRKVRADISGIRVDYFDEEIKAVTFHQADIHKNEEGLLQTNIVFDI